MHGCIVHLEYLIVCQVLMQTRVSGNHLLYHKLLKICVLCLKHCVMYQEMLHISVVYWIRKVV
jgi:hypothetical protein